MPRYKTRHIIAIHLIALVVFLGLVYFFGQNPRIILYGLSIGLLLRFISVWLLSNYALSSHDPDSLLNRFTRPPEKSERSRPLKDGKTRRKAGLSSYIGLILVMMLIIGITQAMGTGTGFLKENILIPELSWGLLISFAYWIEDMASRNIIIAAGEPTPVNLGYNVSGLYFLLSALLITNLLFALLIPFIMILSDLSHGFSEFLKKGIPLDWIIVCVLMLIRFAYDIRLPKKDHRYGKRLLSHQNMDKLQ